MSAFINQQALNLIDIFEKTVKKELEGTRYRQVTNIYHLAENVKGIISTGNQTGEGWFLTAEMVELMKDGITNIVCVQPFACLPNHIVGKSVIKRQGNAKFARSKAPEHSKPFSKLLIFHSPCLTFFLFHQT